MNLKLALAIAATLALPTLAGAQPDDDFEFEDTTAGMNMAAGEALKKADQALNRTWKAIRKGLTKEQRALLLKGQRAWLKYRDATCDFHLTWGGTIAVSERLSCLAGLTKDRTSELRELVRTPGL